MVERFNVRSHAKPMGQFQAKAQLYVVHPKTLLISSEHNFVFQSMTIYRKKNELWSV